MFFILVFVVVVVIVVVIVVIVVAAVSLDHKLRYGLNKAALSSSMDLRNVQIGRSTSSSLSARLIILITITTSIQQCAGALKRIRRADSGLQERNHQAPAASTIRSPRR